ncbi:MAG: DUF3570 domain-containing protein [Chlorobiaceae bacterium]|nr:DUF3570 domain-containing protein [Chlorobiaceae bacterium]
MRLHAKVKSARLSSVLLGAALALPSGQMLYADAPPERGVVSMKYLNYQDSQSGDSALTTGMQRDRIAVNAFTVMATAPIAGKWSIGTSFMEDSVTGASPAYHSSGFPANNAVSGASGEIRYAGDLNLTRYFSQGTLGAALSYSKESDYISRSASLQGSWSTEDKNTTFTLGGSFTDDTIKLNAPNVVAVKKQDRNEGKQILAGLLGVTRVLSKRDIVQLNLGYSNGNGYYTDPYKDPDQRPGDRNNMTLLTRWNHHFDGSDGTIRLSWRYYTDSFGIRAHTLGGEYVQPLHHGWTITPLLRLYTQSGADFYVAAGPAEQANPSTATPPPAGALFYTEDQRLSAFGAVTAGVKISKQLSRDWLVDLKFEKYEQRQQWALFGNGDPGVTAFHARSVQAGVSRQF